jgi:type I restriction enzyme R subunit
LPLSAVSGGTSDAETAQDGILESELRAASTYLAGEPERRKQMVQLTRKIYDILQESVYMIDFFDKPDELKKVRRAIKRAIMESDLVVKKKPLNRVRDRYMDLARAHFEQR